MNIDFNTIAIVTLSALSAFFAIGYIRARIADKFSKIREEMDSNLLEIYAELDRMHQRMTRIEERMVSSKNDCCREKNYYNSSSH